MLCVLSLNMRMRKKYGKKYTTKRSLYWEESGELEENIRSKSTIFILNIKDFTRKRGDNKNDKR